MSWLKCDISSPLSEASRTTFQLRPSAIVTPAWLLSYAVQTGFEWAVGPYTSIGPLLMLGRVTLLDAARAAE